MTVCFPKTFALGVHISVHQGWNNIGLLGVP